VGLRPAGDPVGADVTSEDDVAAAGAGEARAVIGNELLYAEDLEVGLSIPLGSYQTTHSEIIAFAERWDPQPFHIDDAAAAQGYFGGVIASGVHTLAIFQRLAVLGAYRSWAIIAGRTIREVQLTSPVRAGATLHGTLSILEIELSRHDRALVTTGGSLVDDSGDPVLTVELQAYLRRRPAPPEGAGRRDGSDVSDRRLRR